MNETLISFLRSFPFKDLISFLRSFGPNFIPSPEGRRIEDGAGGLKIRGGEASGKMGRFLSFGSSNLRFKELIIYCIF
jgi:hypothetical protein